MMQDQEFTVRKRICTAADGYMATVEFMLLKKEKEVLLNVMNYGQSTENP